MLEVAVPLGYDMELLSQDQMDEKALIDLRGVVRTTYKTLNGHTFQNLQAFAPGIGLG